MHKFACLGRLALLGSSLLYCGGALAAEIDAQVGVRLAMGHDSNPLLVSGDGPNGLFTQLGFDTDLDLKLGPRLGFFVDADGRRRVHGSGLSGADQSAGRLRAGMALSRLGGRVSMAFGGQYSVHRSTFTDPTTGLVYETPVSPTTDPPSATPIPDRFDYDSTGAFLDARWSANRRVQVSLEALLQGADYVQDYKEGTGLTALDHGSLTLEPGVLLRLNDQTSLGISLVLTDLDYVEQPALDAQGSPVPGTPREYRYIEYRCLLNVKPGERSRVRFGHRRLDREDTFAGYYSFGARTTFISLDRRLGEKNELQLHAAIRGLDYDRATVPGSTEEVRAGTTRNLSARFVRELRPKLRWFAESAVQRAENRDPTFAYHRDSVLAGIEYRH